MSEHQTIARTQIAAITDQIASLVDSRDTLASSLSAAVSGTIEHIDILARLSQIDLLLRELQHTRSQWLMAMLTRQFILTLNAPDPA